MQTLQRAEEFARLYGVGALSQQTLLELLGLSQRDDRSPPLVFESTPSRRPNAIMQHWLRSSINATAEPGGDALRIRGVCVPDLIYIDE